MEIEKTHYLRKAQKILDEHCAKGDKLESITMGDLDTRLDMRFVPAEKGKKYEYKVIASHFSKKMNKLIKECEDAGYKMFRHFGYDLDTADAMIFFKVHSKKENR